MKTIKIKTKRFKRYTAKTANSKLERLADYSGSGEKWAGADYDPATIADNSPDQMTLPIRTGYKTESIKNYRP